jgi:hypothetical protein
MVKPMPTLKRFIFSLIIVVITATLVTKSSQAQSNQLILVYNNLADGMVLYNGVSGDKIDLLSASDTRRYDYELALAPDNLHVAIYTVSFEKGAVNRADYSTHTYTLDVFALPLGEHVLSRNLLPEGFVPPTSETPVSGEQSHELIRALGEMVWTPNGMQLAWVEGTATDARVLVWDAVNNKVLEPSDDAGYPSTLRWSPSGEQLASVNVETFFGEASPNGTDLVLYNIPEDTTASIDLATNAPYVWLTDWADESTLLWSPFDPRGGALGIFAYSLADEASTEIVDAEQPISIPKWDASSQTLAFAVPLLLREEGAPPQAGLAPGAYVVMGLGSDPELLKAGDNLYGVSFTLPETLAIGNDILIRLSDRKELTLSELRRPDYSPDGTYALGERESQTFVRDLATNEETLIANLYYLDGQWLNNETFIAQIGAYGSTIGLGSVGGNFTNLVDDVGDGQFVGFLVE